MSGLSVDGPRPAKRYVGTGDILQLERDMFHDVSEPRTFAFTHTAHEAAGYLVRAAVIIQPGQQFEQRVDECRPELAGRPLLEVAQVQYVSNDREMRPEVGANVDIGADYLHCIPLCGTRLSRRDVKAPAADQNV